ncbi:MAG: hypothetical protein ABIT36_04160 [Steroidobacteraceae bacterium]
MRTNSIVRSLTAAALLFTSTLALAADASLAGTWNLSIESPQGKRTPTLVLTQAGNVISGSYRSQMGEAPVTGKVTGNEFSFEVKMSRQGQDIVIGYKGTVTGDAMTGTLHMGQMGDAAFTGKRLP